MIESFTAAGWVEMYLKHLGLTIEQWATLINIITIPIELLNAY